MQFTIIASLFLASVALAAPVEKRQFDGTTCGNNYYSADQLNAAVQQSNSGGSGRYPHTFSNYEGFNLNGNSPYQEYPVLEYGVYTGGPPGADRVIIDAYGYYAGSLTHTGASGNNFVPCSDTS